ncbi:MAG: hypothetical protein AAFV32_06910 [Myxococcota bacterium]
MNLFSRLTIVCGAVCVAAPAYAGSDGARLSKVAVQDNRVILHANGGWSSSVNDGCDSEATVQFDGTTPSGELLYRQAVSAFLAGKPVEVRTSGCIGSPGQTRPRVEGIVIND